VSGVHASRADILMRAIAKGKPTDPELKKKVTEGTSELISLRSLSSVELNASPLSIFRIANENLTLVIEVKQQTNKDGSGAGKMAAWKVSFSCSYTYFYTKKLLEAAKIGKEYEAQGGDYENEAGSKNKPEKGPPQKKSEATKKAELSEAKDTNAAKKDEPKEEKKTVGRPKGAKSNTAKKDKAAPREGERKSSRVAAQPKKEEAKEETKKSNVKTVKKRKSETGEKEKPAAKKAKK